MKDDGKTGQRQSTAAIDWEEVRRRLEATGAAPGHGWLPTDAEKKEILKRRAKEMAKESKEPERQGDSLEIVEFLLSQERYGIESSFVREVCRLRELTPLPGTPPFVCGIMNVRGRIVSVLDIRKFFDLPERGLTELNRVLVLCTDGMEFGILADALQGAREIPRDELQPSLPTLAGIRDEYLIGVTRDRVVILDAQKLLKSKTVIVDESADA